jgi:MFS transporter, SP family, sugar:H+ symporter
MYQSETAPKQVRGALVSCYQLFITLGIFVAYCINFGTEADPSPRSWRLPMGISFIWPFIMAACILLLCESPRWDYRHGRIERARATIAKSYGVSENHRVVARELKEIREKFEAESVGGKRKAYEIFTGPRMLYRVLLGVGLQALQQLTGESYSRTHYLEYDSH